ncbi:calcium ATPase SERCA-like, putative [Babesia bigemina]|uniref:P-type Ca(2+) transporter n=1 Tax=Babesia bigemina TaxID=5866 RepID=A0A061D1Z9_BABBI|nr:calcium ATPase SERCA-like, putative [Babesia bigemina]CDR94147.1 calcium ATPase SERCA-like, putative [Babesia bigemina]|eukprot:XP_012766333.1 calcium ATPase SERCA-like, putative [Babesia bigemina]
MAGNRAVATEKSGDLVVLRTPHTSSVDDVLKHYRVTLEKGLDSKAVEDRRRLFGANMLEQKAKESIWVLFLGQFDDMLVKILLGAAIVSFVLTLTEVTDSYAITDFIEPLVIVVILVLNAFVGVWQETNAEQALDALKKLQSTVATCLRDGKWVTIDSVDLVVGDIVRMRTGNKVPADLRVCSISSTSLSCEQSQLTGESRNVAKTSKPIPAGMENCEIQEKRNLLFCGTTVSAGSCVGVVVATGMQTEIGAIQAAVLDAGSQERGTPLQRMLSDFSTSLSKFISVICIAVWVINVRNFNDPIHHSFMKGCIYYFKIAIALAVAAIPEGLPAVITTSLALGTRNMAKRNAIVRKLPSVETLGCTTVICSDKTGTITTNKMRAQVLKLVGNDDKVRSVHFTDDGKIDTTKGNSNEIAPGQGLNGPFGKLLSAVFKCGCICSEAAVEQEEGEPTELAILHMVNDVHAFLTPNGSAIVSAEYQKQIRKEATLEFCRDRKMMSVIASEDGGHQLYTKGAPESVIERCNMYMKADGTMSPITPAVKATIMQEVEMMARDALRTLAFACSNDAAGALQIYKQKSASGEISEGSPEFFQEIERDLVFLGLTGILDPPRPQVRQAIEMAHTAGIRVFMITGDNKLTAEAIAKRVGILPPEFPAASDRVCYSYTGKEFEKLSDSEKRRVVSGHGVVFSRTEPKHKQDIVSILKQLGETVAMTGDGVNDAPALKMADIGIAMGITGTEVAKEAADMILVDDNFQSIVAAIEEGRCIYSNMKSFIRYLISSNIGEVASIFLTAAMGIPEGMMPVKLLWVNLVTDGLPATALSFNPPDHKVMLKPPRSNDEKLIDGWTFLRYLIIGLYVGVSTVGSFVWWYVRGISPNDGNTTVTLKQLMSFSKCTQWSDFSVNRLEGMTDDMCSYFTLGKIKPATISLTVLVMIEMFNAYNAVSEESSLFCTPPWLNPHLMVATTISFTIHCIILYTPFLASVFGVVPLDKHDWIAVLMWSFPVIIIDEIIKWVGRNYIRRSQRHEEPTKPMADKKAD